MYLDYHHFRKDRRCDKSNLAAAAMKIIEDALVQIHVIADDRWSFVTGFAHSFAIEPKEGLRVRIIDMGKRSP